MVCIGSLAFNKTLNLHLCPLSPLCYIFHSVQFLKWFQIKKGCFFCSANTYIIWNNVFSSELICNSLVDSKFINYVVYWPCYIIYNTYIVLKVHIRWMFVYLLWTKYSKIPTICGWIIHFAAYPRSPNFSQLHNEYKETEALKRLQILVA